MIVDEEMKKRALAISIEQAKELRRKYGLKYSDDPRVGTAAVSTPKQESTPSTLPDRAQEPTSK